MTDEKQEALDRANTEIAHARRLLGGPATFDNVNDAIETLTRARQRLHFVEGLEDHHLGGRS